MEQDTATYQADAGQAPRVVITAVTLSGNKGAEGMFWALYENIRARFPDARFEVASYYPEVDQARAPEGVSVVSSTPQDLAGSVFAGTLAYALLAKMGLRLPGLLPAFSKAVGRADLLLDAAGVAFSDGREKFLGFNVLSMLPALLLGTPAVKCSQALGPFEGRLNRGVSKWFLPKLARVFARGAQTLEFVERLGGVQVSLASDLVFSLTPEPLPGDMALPQPAEGGLVIGVSPSSLVESKSAKRGLDYCGSLAGFISRLLREGPHQVLLVPHSIRRDTDKARNNDLPTCGRIFDLVGPHPNLTLVDRELSPAQLKTLIGSCDFFVASRFHSMVAALSGAVPLLVCGWGHKYLEVLDEFDLGHLAFDFSELCCETVSERFARLREQGDQVHQSIVANLPRVREQSRAQFEFIFEFLSEKGRS